MSSGRAYSGLMGDRRPFSFTLGAPSVSHIGVMTVEPAVVPTDMRRTSSTSDAVRDALR